MIDLAILWHMHQPVYRDPRSGEFILPWVRLHAARAYYDMARTLERHPGAHVHVNFVPSLLDQLESYAQGVARDRWLELTERPAADLELGEREAIWSRFFMVDWETEVRSIPRYHELLLRRGTDLSRVDLPRLARESLTEELRDLQVLFNLAWTGFALRAEDPALTELLRRGRDFSEEDKQPVLAAHRRAAQAIVPLYRALSDRGQVELTTTPYYHPILPLVIDSQSARPGLPQNHLPQRFQFPEDARWQVGAAVASHVRRFGKAPLGMWPAEGSVSEEAAALFAEAGVRWIASDEGVLARSLDAPDGRALQAPHRLETAHGPITLVFRDRGLSDLIGFTYAKKKAPEAVADFLSHLRTIGAAHGGAAHGGDARGPGAHGERPLVSIILDGENPWEHYPNSGRDFLDALYGALEKSDSPARTVRLGSALPERSARPLTRLHPGSWIDANFRIWIGHAEDVQGWEALGKVRRALAAAEAGGRMEADQLAKARECVRIAEGSDWFWWYGDDFSTDNAAEFDALFRGYLAVACEALGVPPPPEIAEPISAAARRRPAAGGEDLRLPTSLLHPQIDGQTTRFGEWAGAGLLAAGRGRGAMAQGAVLFREVGFGFDCAPPKGSGSEPSSGNLYLRLRPAKAFTDPVSVELELSGPAGTRHLTARFPQAVPTHLEGDRAERLGRSAGVDILELSVPLASVGAAVGTRVELAIRVLKDAVELQRLPATGVLGLSVPGPEFDRIHWKV